MFWRIFEEDTSMGGLAYLPVCHTVSESLCNDPCSLLHAFTFLSIVFSVEIGLRVIAVRVVVIPKRESDKRSHQTPSPVSL